MDTWIWWPHHGIYCMASRGIYNIHYKLYTLQYTVYTTLLLYSIHLQYTLHCHYTVYTIQYTLHCHYTVYTTLPLYGIHHAVYTTLPLYSIHYTLYSIQHASEKKNKICIKFMKYTRNVRIVGVYVYYTNV